MPTSGDSWTAREIAQQPAILRETQAVVRAAQPALDAFLAPLLADPNLLICFAGAGTSAFIGECLAASLARQLGRRVEAIGTTDIVSAPSLYLPAVPTLLISFGRSGNSPESLAAIELADATLARVHHLIITCNPDGALARRVHSNTHVITLPDAAHDRGFAMTSSFSGMMWAALSILTGDETMDGRVDAVAAAVGDVLAQSDALTTTLAARRFDRVVYLGSGPFKSLAREAALKLLELTDGAIISAWDSTMGFRHGPKTIVTAQTLVMVFVSNDPLTRRYDLDLIDELRADGKGTVVVLSSETLTTSESITVPTLAAAADVDLLFPFIVPAQLFALHCSVGLGLTPDQPSVSGTVNRVVQGVTIHPTPA